MKPIPLLTALVAGLILSLALTVAADPVHPIGYPTIHHYDMRLVDLDADGDNDLVARGSDFRWYEQNEDHSWATHLLDEVEMWDVEIVDFNGDGFVDVLGGNEDGELMAWMGNGSGSFSRQVLADTGTGIKTVAVMDLEEDGDLDVLGLSTTPDNSALVWFLNDGTGSLTATSLLDNLGVAQFGPELTLADLNSDGTPEIVLLATERVSVWQGLTPQTVTLVYESGDTQQGGVVADVTGDQVPDILCTQGQDWYLHRALTNPGDFTFAVDVIASGLMTYGGEVIDYDLDGDLDVVSEDLINIWLFANDGSGVFEPELLYQDTSSYRQILPGDVDSDGDIDLILSENGFVFWLENDEVGVDDARAGTTNTLLPSQVELSVFPNPFNAMATVQLRVPHGPAARLTMVDLLGRTTNTISAGPYTPGQHTVTLDASTLPSGTYLLRLNGAEQTVTRRITVVK